MKRGFTLIEIIIYTALLALILIAVVGVVLISAKNVSEMKSEQKIFSSADSAMETMIRELRQASSVVLPSSTLGSDPGTLALRTVQTPGGSTVITRTFSVDTGRLQKNDDGANELLTPPEVRITSLIFWERATTTSEIVSIKMTMEAGDANNLKTHTFYGSAVLRAKY